MLPVLFRIGRIEIHAYGIMLAISFLVGIYFSMYRARKRGIDKNHIMDMSLIVILCSIVGSRLLYVVTHLEEYRGHWLDTISPFQSSGEIGIAGLSMLGGVVFALAAIITYAVLKKISILKLCDVLAPAFAFGLFLTRIGCFLNGCCFGNPCNLPWAIKFPLNSAAGATLPGSFLHPTQLYSSLYGLVIFIVLLLLDRRNRPDGFITSLFLMLYGAGRFTVDFIRYYEASVTFHLFGLSLTVNQAISFLLFLSGLILFLGLGKRENTRKNIS